MVYYDQTFKHKPTCASVKRSLLDSGSGGRISWDRIILPVFVRSNYFASFHEIEIGDKWFFDHEIELFCQFSWGQN